MNLSAKVAGRLTKTPLLAVLVTKGKRPLLPAGVELPKGFLDSCPGEKRKTAFTWSTSGPAERVLLVGLGPAKEVGAEELRRASAVAAKRAEAEGAGKLTLWIDAHVAGLAGGSADCGRDVAEGARLGAYQYVGGKSERPRTECKSLDVVGPDPAFRRGAQKGFVLAEANVYTRDLQNRPGNEITPSVLASEARKLAKRSPRITTKVIDEKGMLAAGMGLLLGVSQGSKQAAKLIHLTYKPGGKVKGKVCLVGKGLTFDAGGISLKSASKMDEMRYDMSGGAAVLGVFHALAKLDVLWEVHGVVPASENLMDGSATKPGDIHRAMNGTTVEVLNTDAEGRLILADALCYAEQKIEPDTIIDLATLTGAVVAGLGHELSGAYASTPALQEALVAAGERVGELVWPMPLLEVHKSAMKGRVADLANISSPSVGAGSVTGAAFLSNFVSDSTEWCHLDIAGTAWGAAQRDWVGGAQGTGVGTRLLIEYLETRK